MINSSRESVYIYTRTYVPELSHDVIETVHARTRVRIRYVHVRTARFADGSFGILGVHVSITEAASKAVCILIARS